MMELQIASKRTNEVGRLKLPIDERKFEGVTFSKSDFFIKRVKSEYDFKIRSNEDILILNKYLLIFSKLNEYNRNKILAMSSRTYFVEAMERMSDYTLLENIHSIEEYGEYVATKEANLPKRFLRHMNFKKYGEDVIRMYRECYFTKYGVLILWE